MTAEDWFRRAAKAKNNSEEKIRSYTEAIRLKPDYSDAHVNRGMALLLLDRTDEADQSFDRALALRPKQIQAIVKTAFGSLNAASYILLRVVDAAAARQWLRVLTPASLADGHVDEAYQIAFTAAGLRELGVDKEIMKDFSPEFAEGMAGDKNRSRRLGDIGENDPEKWRWGVGDREPHVLLILLARDAERLEALVDSMLEQALGAGLSKIDVLATSDMKGLEPFGFADGGSQPSFDWDRPRTPGT